METSDTPGNGTPQPRLLLVSDDVEDFDLLRAQLDGAGECTFQLDHAWPAEAGKRLRERSYSLVLIASPGWSAPAPDVNIPPTLTLDDHSVGSEISERIQREICQRARGCELSECCAGLALLGAIERYRIERRCRRSEEILHKLRRTVEQLPDMVVITDRSGAIEYVNPAFERLTGYSRDEVSGQTLGILKSDQQVGELFERMWEIVLSGHVFHGVIAERKKNGEVLVVEKTIAPFIDSDGKVTHFISTASDLTERRRLEADLRHMQKMDAIGRLAGGVAHDFNNLLMVITAYAELMLDSLPPESELRQNIVEIMRASSKAGDLTRQLLAFGRKQVQSLQVLDLASVVAEIGRMLPRLLGEDIQLTITSGEDLGKVKADRTQIEQIVMNLAANARDAMPSGGKLRIETVNATLDHSYRDRHSMVLEGDYVMLSVSDTGQGIPSEHLPHIFEPFYTTKESGKGTGLGLATVYGIVKQSGGFIWVYTEPGMGTTFKIYLPRTTASSALPPARKVMLRPAEGSETVLLVEDEPAVREIAREYLTRQGYTIMEASNGADALRLSREYCGPIQLMISDVVMPDMGGPKLAEQLAAERPDMKVLFVSGYAESNILQHGNPSIGAQFLQKPFALKTLAAKIREVLGPSNSASAAAAQ